MRFRRTAGALPADPGPPMLIGVEDLKTPAWAEAIETVGGSSAGRMLRSAPIALGVLVRMAWRASPRLTLLAAVVELASGCATAFGLLATANVLTQLLQAAQSGAGAGGAASGGAQRVGQRAGREAVLRVVRADDLAAAPAGNHRRPDHRPAGVG